MSLLRNSPNNHNNNGEDMQTMVATAFQNIRNQLMVAERNLLQKIKSRIVETDSSFDNSFVITAATTIQGVTDTSSSSSSSSRTDKARNASNIGITRSNNETPDGGRRSPRKKRKTSLRPRHNNSSIDKKKSRRQQLKTKPRVASTKNNNSASGKTTLRPRRNNSSIDKKKSRRQLKTKPRVTSTTSNNIAPVNNLMVGSRGDISTGKMIIYNALPEDDKQQRSFRVGRIIDMNPHTNPGQVQVHHYDNYKKNKKKMTSMPFKPAYSNDSIDNPIEVYARKINSKMVTRYGSFTKMYNWIPQRDVILCFDNLTKQSKVPTDIINRYIQIKNPQKTKEEQAQ